jgi:hypothetical protein
LKDSTSGIKFGVAVNLVISLIKFDVFSKYKKFSLKYIASPLEHEIYARF